MQDNHTDTATASEADATGKPARHPVRTALWVVLAFLVGLIGAGVVMLVVTDRALVMPAALTQRIEARLNAGLTDGRIDLGQIELALDRGLPRVAARNVELRDKGGFGIVRLAHVRAALEPLALLRGEINLRRLSLSGAELTVRRNSDGGFSLNFDQQARTFAGMGAVLDAADAAFARAPLAQVERIEADGLTLALEDARSGRLWQVTGGRITLKRGATGLDVNAVGDIFNGTDDVAQAQVSVQTWADSGRAVLSATVDGVAAQDVALQSPVLSFLGVLDAPISGALRTALDDAGLPETLAGKLEIGAGALSPAGARPLKFDSARAYFDYDALQQKISFAEVRAQSDLLSFTATGHSYLRDIADDGWPRALVGQFALADLNVAALDLFAAPLRFEGGAVDLRLRPDPFELEIGQLVLMDQVQPADGHLRVRGNIHADDRGWTVALDAAADRLSTGRLVALWPLTLAARTRDWLQANVVTGELFGLEAALRLEPGKPRNLGTSFSFRDGSLRYLPGMPPLEGADGFVTITGDRLSLQLAAGRVSPPLGGQIDMAGSTLVIDDIRQKPSPGHFHLASNGTLTGALSLVRQLPGSGMAPDAPVEIADARALLDTTFTLPMGRPVQPGSIAYRSEGQLIGLRSETLVPGHVLSADRVRVEATPSAIIAEGSGHIDALAVSGRWRRGLAPEEAGTSDLRGRIELSQGFVDTFDIGLPTGSVSGRGWGDISIGLRDGAAPSFRLTSDLDGVVLRLASLDWAKRASGTGRLLVEGALGDIPEIDRVEIEAAGLNAAGRVDLAEGGRFVGATFDRVQVGGWLDSPVSLQAGAGGAAPVIRVQGGTYDLRRADLGDSEAGEARGPVEIALDRLIITEGIQLTEVRGDLAPGTGLNGSLTGRINGGTPVLAEMVQGPRGATVRISSPNAGRAIMDAGFLENARGGSLDLVLQPTGREGEYDGLLRVRGAWVLDAPAFAELLSAISLVGILEQLAGGGINFDTVEAEFLLTPDQVVLYRSSAVGPSLGLSMDGRYLLAEDRMDMQGVISPFYALNALGSILTRKGEGLVGINFNLTGNPDAPRVQVNPLSVLTPGMFRDIFRRPPPEPENR